MRYSLIGRELVNDVSATHLAANGVAGLIAVVACDKPPVGTVAALLEHNVPSVILSDGSIRPGSDPEDVYKRQQYTQRRLQRSVTDMRRSLWIRP